MIEIMKNEQSDIVTCNYSSYSQHDNYWKDHSSGIGNLKHKIINTYNRETALRALSNGEVDHIVWNKLYKSSLWNIVRFPVGHVYEDIETMFQVFNLSSKICKINKSLCYHRNRKDSITDDLSQKNISDYLLSCLHFEDFIRDNIPAIFTEAHLRKSQHLRFIQMIKFYTLYIQDSENW